MDGGGGGGMSVWIIRQRVRYYANILELIIY